MLLSLAKLKAHGCSRFFAPIVVSAIFSRIVVGESEDPFRRISSDSYLGELGVLGESYFLFRARTTPALGVGLACLARFSCLAATLTR